MSEEPQPKNTGLREAYTEYERQKCFIAYSEKARWKDDLFAACNGVLARPEFDLQPDSADHHLRPGMPLRQKVLELIANARFGIYDLSEWPDESGVWQRPANVFIELGMAIALNRPTLLLRHSSNDGRELPECLRSVADQVVRWGGHTTLTYALEERLPQWVAAPPAREWWNLFCVFGGRTCKYREVSPSQSPLGRREILCHLSDGNDSDRLDYRESVLSILNRYDHLECKQLDELPLADGYTFHLCGHCQTVRSSPMAIYRITPNTPAETFIAIGISLALEKQFGYAIPKVMMTERAADVPSLLRGDDVVEARNDRDRKLRLTAFVPEVIKQVRRTIWKPRPLPFLEFVIDEQEALHDRTPQAAFEVGQLVMARVVGLDHQSVLCVLGDNLNVHLLQSEWKLVGDELPAMGDEVPLAVVNVDARLGIASFSYVQGRKLADANAFFENLNVGDEVSGVVLARLPEGLRIDVGGVETVVPRSEIDEEFWLDSTTIEGKRFECIITEIDSTKRQVSVSLRQRAEMQRAIRRQSLLNELQVGQVRSARVLRIDSAEAAVDLDGLEARLLPSAGTSTGPDRWPELVRVGNELPVVVDSVNRESGEATVRLKEPGLSRDEIARRFPPKSNHQGTVADVVQAGIKVVLESGVTGFISRDQFRNLSSDVDLARIFAKDMGIQVTVVGQTEPQDKFHEGNLVLQFGTQSSNGGQFSRVYLLAKELDMDSKELMEVCKELGIPARSQLASIGHLEQSLIRHYLEKSGRTRPLRKPEFKPPPIARAPLPSKIQFIPPITPPPYTKPVLKRTSPPPPTAPKGPSPAPSPPLSPTPPGIPLTQARSMPRKTATAPPAPPPVQSQSPDGFKPNEVRKGTVIELSPTHARIQLAPGVFGDINAARIERFRQRYHLQVGYHIKVRLVSFDPSTRIYELALP